MEKFDRDDSILDLGFDVDPAQPGSDDAMPKPQHWPLDEHAPDLHLPPPGLAITGTQLRRRLITPETLAAMAADEPKPSLIQRLFKRR